MQIDQTPFSRAAIHPIIQLSIIQLSKSFFFPQPPGLAYNLVKIRHFTRDIVTSRINIGDFRHG